MSEYFDIHMFNSHSTIRSIEQCYVELEPPTVSDEEASGIAAILSYIKQAGGLERLREIILKEKFCKYS